ncbi:MULTISPECIES: response regulator [Flavobacterium]|uniref:response regulator n=1 Tax=Flavobacterium TaxID=237 RepID=UPI002113C023|nr:MULTISPECIES: response regulator [Flavobacterium]UUF12426.1 response regulator [Flavobacterium panici]
MAFENHNTQRYIYLADDDSDDRDLFAEALREVDPAVLLMQAKDGMDLMESLLTLCSGELPEFIFLDINMPRKSGFECLQEIRNHESLKGLNVIMFSTCSNSDTIQKALQMGATFYAVKPSSYNRLKSLLEDVLGMDLAADLEAKSGLLLK